MVGFGSSLRLARRPGWEGAYLDYEALKLLLSHIEAIYEEEGQNSNAWDADTERLYPRSKRKARRKRKNEEAPVPRDYKEALFLESNSDFAYVSVESTDEEDFSVDEVKSSHEKDDHLPPTAQPFTLSSYSQIPENDGSSEEDEDGHMTASLCWGGVKSRTSGNSTASNTTTTSATKKSRQTRKKGGASSQLSSISDHEADQFYTSSNAYYRTKHSNVHHSQPSETPLKSYHPDTTLSNAGFFEESLQYFPSSPHPTEATSLLFSKQETPPQQKSALFTFATGGEPLTPPASYMYPRSVDPPTQYNTNFWELYRTPKASTTNANTLQQPPLSHTVQSAARSELPDRTKRERQLRRRQLRQRRRQRATTVPHSLRVAHSKARAITERFLGLLKAETEKVLLFAQSRLGELADTAGSLRFPAFDEEYASNQKSARYPSAQGENYHFGDGLHPSASSSSEEGGSRPPWGSSSSEDDGEEEVLLPSAEGVPTTGTRPESDAILYVRRQIAHFTELRKRRAIFQRSEHILGEDMLFLSAVEEADGYTAVGVELLHTLKYICVNLVAVRKICRKHDRLLVNRMLGGYYQRLDRNPIAHRGSTGFPTLGGTLARISGDTEESMSSRFHLNHSGHKLVGVYDQKIQMLANSPTVRVISSCLALSLSEYEVARSRADALTRLNSAVASNTNDTVQNPNAIKRGDEDSLFDPPSTASTMSLTRLRFTVLSVYAIREVSRSKRDFLMTYLSRASLAFTGQPVIGEGLDGCSRESLEFLLSYNPDAALLRDPTFLFAGLQRNRWSRLPLEQVMISTLATATIEMFVSSDVASTMLDRENVAVAHAVNANPEYEQYMLWNALLNDHRTDGKISAQNFQDQPPELFHWSRTSLFLFMLNYFLSHATTASFLKAAGSPASYSALIIGAPNISALVVALIHCWCGSNEISSTEQSRFSIKSIRGFIIFGAVMGVMGNAIHGYAMNRCSVLLAIVGRLCVGFSSAEILQREVISMCGPSHVIAKSGRLVLARSTGSVVGLLIGGLSAIPMDGVSSDDNGRSISAHSRRVQFASWFVMLLWLVHLILILTRSQVMEDVEEKYPSVDRTVAEEEKEQGTKKPTVTVSEDSDSVSSSSAEIGTPSSVLFRPSLDAVEQIDNAVSTMERHSEWENASTNSPLVRRDDDVQGPFLHRRQLSRQWKSVGRARKLLLFHVAIPISLLVYCYSTFAMEVFCTATPFITDRYFAWNGVHSGLFLACLVASFLPLTFAYEIVARRYEERVVLKRGLTITFWGLLLMVNWQSMLALAEFLPSVFAPTDGRPRHLYDGKLGVFQYVLGLMMVYSSLVALEGASLSLLSKVSPVNTRSLVVNVGSMATVLGLIARLLGDFQIVMIDLSDMIISMDIINALVVPLILACFLLSYFIRKHFFFLL